MGLIAGAEALGQRSRCRRGAGVVDDQHLGAGVAGLRGDRGERDLQVAEALAGGDDDRGGGSHDPDSLGLRGVDGHPASCTTATARAAARSASVEDLLWLVREHMGERAELLERSSRPLESRRGRARALGCCAAGWTEQEVAERCAGSAREVVHAHNLHPAFGWRALAAARAAGARVVLHLHQYRLVCAIGVCFTARCRVHPLPRAQHAPGARAELPRQRSPRRRLRRLAGPPGSARMLERGRRCHRPQRVRQRAAAASSGAAAGSAST